MCACWEEGYQFRVQSCASNKSPRSSKVGAEEVRAKNLLQKTVGSTVTYSEELASRVINTQPRGLRASLDAALRHGLSSDTRSGIDVVSAKEHGILHR